MACCLSDVFRVYAPNPPYDDDVTVDAFKLCVKQLERLAKPDKPGEQQRGLSLTLLSPVPYVLLVLVLMGNYWG